MLLAFAFCHVKFAFICNLTIYKDTKARYPQVTCGKRDARPHRYSKKNKKFLSVTVNICPNDFESYHLKYNFLTKLLVRDNRHLLNRGFFPRRNVKIVDRTMSPVGNRFDAGNCVKWMFEFVTDVSCLLSGDKEQDLEGYCRTFGYRSFFERRLHLEETLYQKFAGVWVPLWQRRHRPTTDHKPSRSDVQEEGRQSDLGTIARSVGFLKRGLIRWLFWIVVRPTIILWPTFIALHLIYCICSQIYE